MTFLELLAALRLAIATDSELTAWAVANYGRTVTVVTRLDERNPPKENQCPICHLYPIAKVGDLQLGENQYTVGFSIGVHEPGDMVENPAADNDQMFPGVERLENMAILIQTAAMTTEHEGIFTRVIRVEYETIEFFPYFLAMMEIEFIRPPEYG